MIVCAASTMASAMSAGNLISLFVIGIPVELRSVSIESALCRIADRGFLICSKLE